MLLNNINFKGAIVIENASVNTDSIRTNVKRKLFEEANETAKAVDKMDMENATADIPKRLDSGDTHTSFIRFISFNFNFLPGKPL